MKILDSFASSYRSNPELTILIVALFASMAAYSTITFADKGLVEVRFEVQAKAIAGLSKQLKASVDDQKIRALETQIFEQERIIEAGQARDVDYSRLNTLRSDLGSVKRNL